MAGVTVYMNPNTHAGSIMAIHKSLIEIKEKEKHEHFQFLAVGLIVIASHCRGRG